MSDAAIVDLYWQRNETAIKETENKYSGYLSKIAYNILSDFEDSKECVNDTYLKAWNSMPEHKPNELSTYLGRITRQVSIDVYRKRSTKKRQSNLSVSLSEVEECVPGKSSPEREAEASLLDGLINAYLRTLPNEKRTVFLCRYFFLDSMKDIAENHGMSVANVKTILHRTRLGLKKYLEKEGGFSI